LSHDHKSSCNFPDPRNKLPDEGLSLETLGKIVARNKNLLQGIIGFGRAILADTPWLDTPWG
jgi:hypothetical protein